MSTFSLSLLHTHTNTIIHTHHYQLTIKPLVSLHAGGLVTVAHQFLLVLLHEAVKTVLIPAFEILLCRFNLLENNQMKTVIRCD